ncbi:MAG: adenylyltransferase/cytidyltransferase family protein [Vicinamibacterales bacterium]
MILTFDELPAYAGRVAMVDGAFDPLHAGHIEYFREAAGRVATPLLCNVASDRYVRTKGRPPLLPEATRATVVDAVRYIAYTHVNEHDTETILEQLRPSHYVKGADWKARGLPPRQVEICGRLGIEIVYLDTMLDSSSRILERFVEEWARINPRTL